jgi:hypothetical protein
MDGIETRNGEQSYGQRFARQVEPAELGEGVDHFSMQVLVSDTARDRDNSDA